MFLPPFRRCPIVRDYVRLDQTASHCRESHGCARDESNCPLENRFVPWQEGALERRLGVDESVRKTSDNE